ncbi:Chemotactic signal transduction system substrate-binding protein CosB [Candidatus Methanobinarius endosymbioticus]|uniref:Chemotactic signal transduction system substrate-binding protein CosB n=1 Tax=Candidatus Methanobinarius endosymbioticus TaxID=2006182 RepID=A0A366M9I3_9EURY|nr:Chemotactic signal transduction system substrate-binding protein CosB [Candidatus Methanobinarius endosymbioticus]
MLNILLEDSFSLLISDHEFFMDLLIQHIQISLISILIAIILGIIIGIIVSEYKKNQWILSVVNFVYTIPSIALFGLLILVSGIGDVSAIIALTVYGLLPMVKNTHSGIVNIDKSILEAAKGMGSTKFQILYKIKIPLTMPHIMAGIRTMSVMTIALAGIAAFIGAGGLGVAIYRGITTNNMAMTIAGSVLIAVLAILVDVIFGQIEKLTQYGKNNSNFVKKIRRITKNNKNNNKNKKPIAIVAIILIIGLISGGIIYSFSSSDTINIASKPYTEQYVLGYMLEELIEGNTDLDVKLSTGIAGGVSTIHPGMEKGYFDLYPEYTGTAWMEVLKKGGIFTKDQNDELKSKYNEKYDMSWIGMYGYENTYGIAVNKEIADKYNLKTYSDLAKVSNGLTFGAEPDFFERNDGYKAISEKYGFNFKDTRDMDVGLKYDAINGNKIDVVVIYTTDGRLVTSDITILEDDLGFFPSYEPGNIIRNDVLKEHPELKEVLSKLEGIITEEDMAKMNYQVEIEKKNPEDVAHDFLKERKLID